MERTETFNVNFSGANTTSSGGSEFTPVFRQSASGFTPVFSQTGLGGAGIDDDHALPTYAWSGYKVNEELNKKANSTALAAAYTAGAAYAVGDYCSYIGDLYICTTATASAPSTFDATKWAKVPVADYIVGATAAEVQAIINNYTAT